jgi:hypothetical protein
MRIGLVVEEKDDLNVPEREGCGMASDVEEGEG